MIRLVKELLFDNGVLTAAMLHAWLLLLLFQPEREKEFEWKLQQTEAALKQELNTERAKSERLRQQFDLQLASVAEVGRLKAPACVCACVCVCVRAYVRVVAWCYADTHSTQHTQHTQHTHTNARASYASLNATAECVP